jgi:phage shock protein PspC (stress-responsive transcriptional regulator)
MEKKVYKSSEDKIVWGICGGLGKYFDIDPTWIRLIFAVLVLLNGVGVILYVILAIIMPQPKTEEGKAEPAEAGAKKAGREKGREIGFGTFLISIGILLFVVLFMHEFIHIYWGSTEFAAALLIIIGILLIVTGKEGKRK